MTLVLLIFKLILFFNATSTISPVASSGCIPKIKKQLSIIEHYGVEAQYKKLVEELDELKEAIVEKHSEAHIIEEMADVLNVMQGIIAKCEYEKDIKDMQEFKLERQIQRIYRENRKDKENV